MIALDGEVGVIRMLGWISEGEGVGVAFIRVDGSEGADGGVGRGVLGDGFVIEGEADRCLILVDVGYRDGEDLLDAEPTGVRAIYSNAVFVLGLEVCGLVELQFIAINGEGGIVRISFAGSQCEGGYCIQHFMLVQCSYPFRSQNHVINTDIIDLSSEVTGFTVCVIVPDD